MLSNRGLMFGVTTPSELLELAETAEDSGRFDSVWVGDSILAKPRLEAVALLAAIAARTRSVRLGPACLSSFPLRHAVQLAHQWASLDLLAGGRTILVACLGGGVASGEFVREYWTFGADPAERVARLEEGIAVIRRLWTEREVTHQGRYYALDAVTLEPRPPQAPPIWIANNPDASGAGTTVAERAFRRVAWLADGWMTAFVSPEQFARNYGVIRRFLVEAGRPPHLPTALYFNVNVRHDRPAALDESKRYFDAYYGGAVPDALIEGALAYGRAEDCAERLLAYFAAGVETVCLRLTSWDQPGQLRRVVDEVIPACLARWPPFIAAGPP